ncbi:kinetochore-associated protein DSN1 homolog [Ammospiza caudacuta]|uniref:kinetochore-associated protein DSN1 homolog n=1 Tax=Ammospiza caudacuta TaxID=2857398 RepID=UPI0027393ABB|nr:kinetochore-associated protein DSN1 homolog [Ammospiza caudacuta]
MEEKNMRSGKGVADSPPAVRAGTAPRLLRDGGEAGAGSAHAQALRASERREAAMAEAAAGAGGSPGPAAAPSPRGSAGLREDERCPGGANPESGGAAAAAEPEVTVKPPSTKGTPSRKRRAAFSPGPGPASLRVSPAAASPQRRRRSWRRSSLKGRRSRRRSLPPVHREVTELSQSISLELPEVQRLSLLLLSSFQFCARKLQQDLEGSEGFDPELFSAKVQKGSEEFQRLLQRLLQDGTLRNCLEPTPGDSLDPALEGSVAQVKLLMASLQGELRAWDRLLQQQRQRSGEAERSLQQLRSGSAPPRPSPRRPLSPRPPPARVWFGPGGAAPGPAAPAAAGGRSPTSRENGAGVPPAEQELPQGPLGAAGFQNVPEAAGVPSPEVAAEEAPEGSARGGGIKTKPQNSQP